MNFKKLEKAAKIFEEIKALDKEIIEIDRLAMLVANGEIKSSFELKIEDLGKQKDDENKARFDEDGSLATGVNSWFNKMMTLPYSIYPPERTQNANEHSLKYDLSENTTMSILGVLLYEKQGRRQALISQLTSFGVTV